MTPEQFDKMIERMEGSWIGDCAFVLTGSCIVVLIAAILAAPIAGLSWLFGFSFWGSWLDWGSITFLGLLVWGIGLSMAGR